MIRSIHILCADRMTGEILCSKQRQFNVELAADQVELSKFFRAFVMKCRSHESLTFSAVSYPLPPEFEPRGESLIEEPLFEFC